MNLKWFKGLSKQQEQELRGDLVLARPSFARLRVLLENELEASISEMGNKDNFFMPAWSEYQANKLGEQKALRKLINLIEDYE